MPPHSKKLKRNGPTNNAATFDFDATLELEASNTNAGDRITDDPLLGERVVAILCTMKEAI